MPDFRQANLFFPGNRLSHSLYVLMIRNVDRVGQAIYLFYSGEQNMESIGNFAEWQCMN